MDYGKSGWDFKKAETSKKVVVKKSSVRISDKSNKDRQDATGSKIFPRESPGTNPQAGQNGSGINVDFSGFGDIFDFLSGSPTKTGPRSGADLFFTLEITPKTADSGTDYDLEVTHTEPCISCDGSGNESRRVSTCSLCGGGGSERKEIESPQGRFVQVKTCSACGGRVQFLMLHAKNAVVPAMYTWTDLLLCISRRALVTMHGFALKDWVTPAVITERTEI